MNCRIQNRRKERQRKRTESPRRKEQPDRKNCCPGGNTGDRRRTAVGIYDKHREPTYQQIGTRYIDDPDWGNVYEISYVVKGK